jgi:hypothetical protein
MQDKLPVQYPSGTFAFLVSPDEARRMIRSCVAEGLGTKKRLHALRLIEGPGRPVAGTRYSHCQQTQDNPKGVYTFREITEIDRDLFRAVEKSVLLGAV